MLVKGSVVGKVMEQVTVADLAQESAEQLGWAVAQVLAVQPVLEMVQASELHQAAECAVAPVLDSAQG